MTGCGGGGGGGGGGDNTNVDLQITGLSLTSGNWTDGQAITGTVTVRNNGTGTVGGAHVGIFLSGNTIISTFDALLTDVSIPSLGSNEQTTADVSFTYNGSTLVGPGLGTLYYGGIIDHREAIAETDESNNVTDSPGSFGHVLLPSDLQVTAVDVSSRTIRDKTRQTISYTLQNAGGGTAPRSLTGIYLSTDARISADDTLVKTVAETALNAGGSQSKTVSIDMDLSNPGAPTAGVYNLLVMADYTDKVVEFDDDNNTRSHSSTITIAAAPASGPDLEIASLSSVDKNWDNGESISVSANVRNAGNATTGGGFRVGLYLSSDGVFNTDDTLIGTANITSALNAGGATTTTYRVDVSSLDLPNGVYHLAAIPDSLGAIAERNEINNQAFVGATITLNGGSKPSGVTSVDANYSGKWGWRGTGTNVGADGPRGTGVAAWASSPISFDSEATAFSGGDDSENALDAIGVDYAHSRGLDGSGVLVAVVDSHILGTHTDLNDNYTGFYNASNEDTDSLTVDDHGTHVAGIIAAEKNGSEMHGVASGADIFGISFQAGSGGSLDINANRLSNGIRVAASKGARIFNNSWGGSGSIIDDSVLRSAMADAIDQGAVFVWAAGNSYRSSNPTATSAEALKALEYAELEGGFVNVINLRRGARGGWQIANETTGDSFPSSQACGATMHYCLGAPGDEINSTNASGNYSTFSGTSMAAPVVSGGLAILFQAFPYVETADILKLLFATADDLGAEGVDEIYGHGMMNLQAALQPSGSASIPTSTSTSSNVGISAAATSLSADSSLAGAISTAASDMVMLDSFDRAFVIGSAGISEVSDVNLNSAISLASELQADFDNMWGFGTPITEVAATKGALVQLGDQFALDGHGQSSLRLNTIAKDGAGSAEIQYVALSSGQNWEASRTFGLTQEQGQLFGNVGTGAYALADWATTVSLGANAKRSLGNDVTLFGGVSLNQTYVNDAAGSLIAVPEDLISTSAVVGMRLDGLGKKGQGTFALQLGQDRQVLSGEARIRVPVGREAGGVILFEETTLSREDLSVQPELKVSYSNWTGEDMRYAFSAAANSDQTSLAADIERAF